MASINFLDCLAAFIKVVLFADLNSKEFASILQIISYEVCKLSEFCFSQLILHESLNKEAFNALALKIEIMRWDHQVFV